MKNNNFKKANGIIGLAIILISIGVSGTQAFRDLEWSLYRWCTNFSPEHRASSEIVLVEIDEASIQALGPTPWSRDLLTAVTRKIGKGRPAVIAYTLPFTQGQNQIALKTLDDYLTQNQDKLGKKLKTVEKLRWQLNTDRTFANTLKRYNTVLSIPYTPSLKKTRPTETPALLKTLNLNNANIKDVPYLPGFFELEHPVFVKSIQLPQAAIASAAASLGINSNTTVADGLLSAPPLVFPYGDLHIPSFELLVASHSNALKKKKLNIGNNISFADEIIHTDRAFRIYPNYQISDNHKFQSVSFNEVFNDNISSSSFANKTVLIGDTSDQSAYATLNNRSLPSLNISAHIISSIIQNNANQISNISYLGRLIALSIVGVFLIIVLPRLTLNTGLSYTLIIIITIHMGELLFITLKNIWIPLALPLCALICGHILQTINLLLQKQIKAYQSEISETNILLGQSQQAQGQLDLAFEAYQKCTLNKNLLAYLYNLGLDYERKRQFNKAVKVFEHITNFKANYKDAQQHIDKNQRHDKAIVLGNRKLSSYADTLLLTDNDIENPMLGRYQIKKLIGNGAMGAVYLGADPKIGRTVAIKTMTISSDDEKNISDFRKRFHREAETAGRLNHPNIVTVYDVGEEHDLAYIAMDYIKGHPLSDFTKPRKKLPTAEVVEIIVQVSDALHYAHQNKVVHRDIKPANIIYNRRTKICTITDFGVAHIIDMHHTSTGTILGTPFYMSPEQLAGKRVDGRADIFSVGITLYELLAGERPFEGENLSALMYNIANKKHPDISGKMPELPICIKTIINKCLQKDVSKRYQDAEQLTRALKNCQKQL